MAHLHPESKPKMFSRHFVFVTDIFSDKWLQIKPHRILDFSLFINGKNNSWQLGKMAQIVVPDFHGMYILSCTAKNIHFKSMAIAYISFFPVANPFFQPMEIGKNLYWKLRWFSDIQLIILFIIIDCRSFFTVKKFHLLF